MQVAHSQNYAVTDPALKQEIEDILNSGFRFLRFPTYLEGYFTHAYRKLALKHLLSNTLYLFALYLVLGILAYAQFPDLTSSTFYYTYGLTGVGLAFIHLSARSPRMDKWFHWYTGITAMLILAAMMTTAASIDHPEAVVGMNALTIYTVIIVYSMSKMRFYNTVIWCHLAGVISLIALKALGLSQSLFNYQTFYVMANVIGMGIAYIIEHRERAMFLQGLLLDIDKAEKDILNSNLEKLSREDALTGLANRRYFDERLQMEWNRCLRERKPLSLILLDIDFFKQYNDLYGHMAGDHCLTQVARALKKEASRPAELVGRYGGEEFIMLYPNIDATQIKSTLVRIQQRIIGLNIPHDGSSIAKSVTASLGAATVYPAKQLKPERLISEADQMLYKSKDSGRNCWFNIQISHAEPEQQKLISLS